LQIVCENCNSIDCLCSNYCINDSSLDDVHIQKYTQTINITSTKLRELLNGNTDIIICLFSTDITENCTFTHKLRSRNFSSTSFTNVHNITGVMGCLQNGLINLTVCQSILKISAQVIAFMQIEVISSFSPTVISNNRLIGPFISSPTLNETKKNYVCYNNNISESAETKGKYIDKNALNNDKARFTFNENGLHVVHINIQHLLPKLDEIKCHLSNQSPIDIFGMVETFLHSDVESRSRIKIKNQDQDQEF